MKMKIDKSVYDELTAAAEAAMPLEACGLVSGKDLQATRFYPMTNVDESAEHYMMKPEEQFAAVKDMRERGVDMLAIWHSHPETPSRMSEEDMRLALTGDVVYLIHSMMEPGNPVMKGFEVVDGMSTEIEIVVE